MVCKEVKEEECVWRQDLRELDILGRQCPTLSGQFQALKTFRQVELALQGIADIA